MAHRRQEFAFHTVRSFGLLLRALRLGDGLAQILVNLVANAIKFTPVNGGITVSAEPDDALFVVMRVRDTGPGVALGDADRIFEPFVQLDKSLTRDHQGAGLGLAISRDLARAMGGDVRLEYGDSPGATFALTLKRAD